MGAFTITSDTHQSTSTLKSLYEFLSEFKNFESILPADKVEGFTCAGQECSFNIKGITPLTVRLKDKHPYHFILFSSKGLASFNFELKAVFSGEPDLPGECRIELYGDLNPVIKSMAHKPLLALVNTMSLKLAQL